MGISLFNFLGFYGLTGKQLIDAGDLTKFANYTLGFATGLKALAGGGIPGATQLSIGMNEVDTVTTAGDSAVLPPAVQGAQCFVNNNAATNSLNVYSAAANPSNAGAADVIYPHGSSTANSATTAIAVAAGYVAWFQCTTLGQWKEVSLFS